MPPKEIRVDASNATAAALEPALAALARGEMVGFPTETVLGIGVRADDDDAARRLNGAKGRAADQPLTQHFGSVAAAEARSGPWAPIVHRAAQRFWPGPLTLLLPDPRADGATIGVRVPDHPVFSALARAAGDAVAGTSANRSDAPPARSWSDLPPEVADAVSVLVTGDPPPAGTASTIARPDGDRIDVVREGAIGHAELAEIVGPAMLFVCTGNTCRSPMAKVLFRAAVARAFGDAAPSTVDSAGTAAMSGYPASENAVAAMTARGLSLADHRSAPLTPSALLAADFIACMSPSAAHMIVEHVPEVASRVEVVNDDAGGVPDPFGGSLDRYRACADVLADWIDRFLARHRDRFAAARV